MHPYSKKEKRSLTPEKLVDLLHKKGVEISLQEAEKVLNMLYFLANLVVEHKLKS